MKSMTVEKEIKVGKTRKGLQPSIKIKTVIMTDDYHSKGKISS